MIISNPYICDNSIEADYAKSVSLGHRKKFAQFFTPVQIVDLMTEWLLGNENLKTVLEPAFGLGIFSRVLLSKRSDIQVRGFEVDKTIFAKSNAYFSQSENVSVLLQDYMYNDWQNKYDGIICNPPYFKFHDYDNKKVLKEVEENLKCKLNGFTNLYTLFLLKSIHQLKPNGRCTYVVPSEFLNSDYGKLVKHYLIKTGSLRYIVVIDFEENVFDDALTTASVIFCANDNLTDNVQFCNVKSLSDLNIIKQRISHYPQSQNTLNTFKFSELNPGNKWKVYYQKQNSQNFKHLVPFSTFAKVVRGIATGANDYFTFNSSKATKYAIDKKFMMPCICHARDVNGSFFTKRDFEELKNNDKKIFLFNAGNTSDVNVLKYITKGETECIDKKFLTANRTPWYSLEKRPPSPIWVSVFNRTGLRFIRNEAGIANLTTFHCIYPNQKQLFAELNIDLLFAYLLTDTAKQIFEDNSREYGNGLQKFEPNDINTGQMLDLTRLPNNLEDEIIVMYNQLRQTTSSGNRIQIVDTINDLFIKFYRL